MHTSSPPHYPRHEYASHNHHYTSTILHPPYSYNKQYSVPYTHYPNAMLLHTKYIEVSPSIPMQHEQINLNSKVENPPSLSPYPTSNSYHLQIKTSSNVQSTHQVISITVIVSQHPYSVYNQDKTIQIPQLDLLPTRIRLNNHQDYMRKVMRVSRFMLIERSIPSIDYSVWMVVWMTHFLRV